MAQIIYRKRNGLQEVRFLLKISSKTVCTKHLHRSKQDKMLQILIELLTIHRHIVLQLVYIFFHQLLTQIWMEVRFSLPQKRSYIIIHRTFSSSLKINKVRHQLLLAFRLSFHHHHIARLKIAIHKGTHLTLKQDICQTLKLILQFILLEIQTRSLQKTIFEVVQIPENRAQIKFWLRITLIKIKLLGSHHLQFSQSAHGFA